MVEEIFSVEYIDIERDVGDADQLLEWMDHCPLGPVIPDSNTSLRSVRTIDYPLTVGVDLTIQAHEGETTSDHKPLFGTLGCDWIGDNLGSRTSWSVFSLFLSYVAKFWERAWTGGSYDVAYEKFNSFPALLVARCKHYFPLKLARSSTEPGLTKLLAQSRALSSSPRGFMLPDGEVIKDPQIIADIAAEYYEKLFEAPVVTRPHSYVDAPPTKWDNDSNTKEKTIVGYP